MTVTDLSILIEFTGNDPEKLAKYVKLYLSTAPVQITELKRGLKSHNWDLVRRAAHSLRPQLQYMGMHLAKEKAKKIETIINEKKDLEQVFSISESLESDCEESFQELNKFLASQ